MAKYKLTYFNARGFAEPVRLLLAYLGVDYEDCRIRPDEWAELKPKQPFGLLPVLDVDGVKIGQSSSILRYLAKENGLDGKTPLEAAICDSILCALDDLWAPVQIFMKEKDPAKKEVMKQQFFIETVPPCLTSLERILKVNTTGNGYFVGDEMTYADVAVFNTVQVVAHMERSTLQRFPLLKAHMEKISAIPSVSAWLKTRPVTER